ncbi:ribulose bisphosphate carboxylase small subunit, chloroplastic-like [Rutidosis leptorrhynchoides]|uniref:ribulose bisphosphate carboxylase small subunit, chloroplastic-like n=1 Tax=Rutidosis leptorrhynchoides TaxID=125765 RepID=UPI003A98CEF6
MASISSSAIATVSRTASAQSSLAAPFTGLKANTFPVTKKSNDFSTLPSNGGRVQCMKVWPPLGLKKFETLSYLPPLSNEALAKEVDYLLRNKWVPCLEFELEHGHVYREHGNTPGYYDGRYWTMWKLPMFGCTDSAQVLAEVVECKKEYPQAFIRVIGFDNVRQVQCISFIVSKPAGY